MVLRACAFGSHRLTHSFPFTHAVSRLSKWVDRKHFCLHHGVCMRNGDSIVPGSFTRSDIKWAMWVVRSYAINIYKTTTKKPFLALVP